MSKSRPLYGPLRYDETGRRHLLVLQAEAAQGRDLREAAGEALETWAMEGASGPPHEEGAPDRLFADAATLFDALRERLDRETMGLRLYAVGAEAFLWDLFGLASACGLGRQEVRLSKAGPPARRVFCVHCATMNEDVGADQVVCRGCELTLAVRDHFSRRLSAFMGVHADAEAPGELAQSQPLAS